MPRAAPTVCTYPGCGNLVEGRGARCEVHPYDKPAARVDQDRRGTAAQRGYGSRWRKRAKQYLRANPLCRGCEELGKVTLATLVDHIIPHGGDGKLFWDQDNWQPLCQTCHNRKTQAERIAAKQ